MGFNRGLIGFTPDNNGHLMKIISSIFFYCCVVLAANSQTIQLEIVDQNGEPVPNAVLKTNEKLPETPQLPVAIMDQINKQFSPHVLIIQQGQQVSFPNRDDIRHHVYSFSKAKPFEIRLYQNTPTSPVLFDQAGVVELGCNIHDKMLGYIYITDGFTTYLTDENGKVTITVSEQDISQASLLLWHAKLSKDRLAHQTLTLAKQAQGNYRAQITLMEEAKPTVSGFKSKFGKSL